jgi:hypothetical protein
MPHAPLLRSAGHVLVLLVLLTAGLAADTKFTSTWVAPEARGVHFAGKKVAALVMSSDESLRVSGEEGLVRELAARGLNAVAAYRLIPKEELKDPAKARGWFERTGVQGVIVMRPVSRDKRKTYVPGSAWTSPYYGSLWGYYGYGWGAMYDPGYVREDTVVEIETLIFSVAMDKLLWAGASETKNPKDLPRLLEDLVKEAVKEMRKQGLTGPATKS